MRASLVSLVALAALAGLTACGETAKLVVEEGSGPTPQLPQPVKTLLPTVNIAPAKGWPDQQMPLPAAGLQVQAFASGLDHPRWLLSLPNGDVLVAESNAPPRPQRNQGLRAWVMNKVMAMAGAGVPSANRITLLRDADGDGVAETTSVFADGLNSPFGMALVGQRLFIANTDAVVAFDYVPGALAVQGAAQHLTDLPGGPLNHHWTKNLVASADGSKLYAAVGSNSNVAENGMAVEEGRAAIWEIDVATGNKRLFAQGLRNPVGMAWVTAGPANQPTTQSTEQQPAQLWTVVNERDEIGSDLVPDYMTSVRDGGFYGWPYSYFGNIVDARVQPPRPDLVAKAIRPDYALGPHTASLGLAFSHANALLPALQQGMFVGQHGSWNRRPHSGYKVVFVPFVNGQPNGLPQDVLTGFLSPDGKAWGRPVGVEFDTRGALLVADDVGNVIWRVSIKR